MASGIAYGGPCDGERMEVPSHPGEAIEIWGDWVTTKEPPVRRCRKTYLYEVDEKYRTRLNYVGEDVHWEDEEVTQHGAS